MGITSNMLVKIQFPCIEIKLFHSLDEYAQALKRHNEVADIRNCDAHTTPVRASGCRTVHYVGITGNRTLSQERQLACLVHEAVHICQSYFDEIGEDKPGHEEQAYVIQSICECLFEQHLQWLNSSSGL